MLILLILYELVRKDILLAWSYYRRCDWQKHKHSKSIRTTPHRRITGYFPKITIQVLQYLPIFAGSVIFTIRSILMWQPMTVLVVLVSTSSTSQYYPNVWIGVQFELGLVLQLQLLCRSSLPFDFLPFCFKTKNNQLCLETSDQTTEIIIVHLFSITTLRPSFMSL